MVDRNAGDLFQFSLLNYLHYLPLSEIKLQENGSVVIRMPDHQNIPDIGSRIEHPQNNDSNLQKKPSDGKPNSDKKETGSKEPGFWNKTKNKFKDWFGI